MNSKESNLNKKYNKIIKKLIILKNKKKIQLEVKLKFKKIQK